MNRHRLRPTGLWILFGPILGCMWLAAVNYTNNLVYAVLYLVAGLTFISLFHTWRNLSHLEVDHVRIHPAHAGMEVEVEIFLRNSGRGAACDLSFLRVDGPKLPWLRQRPLACRETKPPRVKGGDTRSIVVQLPPTARGRYHLRALALRSSYPFGLVWAHRLIPVGLVYHVYPQARGRDEWPDHFLGGEDGIASSRRPGDDFFGLRPYVPGKSPRHIDWKAYARGRPLSVKEFAGGSGRELHLDGHALAGLSLEDRLSQLALWVINAEQAGIPYGLRLNAAEIPTGRGPVHLRRTLELLAST